MMAVERIHTDVVIVGAGLVGSAAAAYLAKEPGLRVLCIGAPEPGPNDDPIVYASHYDAARVQRMIGTDAIWTRLNVESAATYPLLEAETGIHFHEPVGCIYVSATGPDAYLARLQEDAHAFSLTYAYMAQAAHLRYHFPQGAAGMIEAGPAGTIDPRALIRAQLARFAARGGAYVPGTVISRTYQEGNHLLTLDDGTQVQAPKVLVAAGAFCNFNGLLPQPLDVAIKGETIILGQVSVDVAAQYAHLPSLLYEVDTGLYEGVYITGPRRYPDGNFYIKMGCNVPEDRFFTDLPALQAWMAYAYPDDPALLPRLTALLRELLPALPFVDFALRRCVIHRTPAKRQYIGHGGAPGLYVAAGCNGYSAMCSDALGRLAAHFVAHETLPGPYLDADFAVVFA